MSFTQQTIHQIALQRFAREETERKVAEEKEKKEIAAATAALREAEHLARIRAEQEREEARIRAERALAEEKIKSEAAALEAAVEAELERLRNRTEVEVLRDELADLKKTVERLSNPPKSSCPKTYALSLVANNANLGCDPHHGTGKVLKVTYRPRRCAPQIAEVEEHKTLILRGQDLEIISASWETNPNRNSPQYFKADVLQRVISYMIEVE